MQENLRLGEEVRSVKKRMEQERQEFHSEIRRLEATADELQTQLVRAAEEHRAVVEDYCQKIDALEKQLKSDKQFIEVCHMLACHFFELQLEFCCDISNCTVQGPDLQNILRFILRLS